MYTEMKEIMMLLMAHRIHTSEVYRIATTDTECPLYFSCPFVPDVATNDHNAVSKCNGLNLRIAMR